MSLRRGRGIWSGFAWVSPMSEDRADGTPNVPPLNMTRQEALVLHALLTREEAGEWENADDGDAVRSLQNKIIRIKHSADTERGE